MEMQMPIHGRDPHHQVLDVLSKTTAIFLIQLLQLKLQLGILNLHLLELALRGEQHLQHRKHTVTPGNQVLPWASYWPAEL